MLPVIVIFALASIPLASAQETPAPAGTPAAVPETSPAAAAAPPVKVAAAAATAQVPFQARANHVPALPESRPCTAGDVVGAWRLAQVYENPPDAAMRDFSATPYQYLLFSGDSTYSSYKNISPGDETSIVAQLSAPSQQGLQQFLVQEGGFIFFYRDGIAIDTQACFIVVNPKDPFTAGQMLMMPPQGQSAVRLVKVYSIISDKQPSHPVNAPPRQQKFLPQCETRCRQDLMRWFKNQDDVQKQCRKICDERRRNLMEKQQSQQGQQ